jgi:hypothetical protein
VSWTQALQEQSRPESLTCPLCRAVLEPAETLKIYMGDRREGHAPRILCACPKALTAMTTRASSGGNGTVVGVTNACPSDTVKVCWFAADSWKPWNTRQND